MSDPLAPIPPHSRYVPAREEWLEDWIGPALFLGSNGPRCVAVVRSKLQATGVHRTFFRRTEGDGWELVYYADTSLILLDPTRPEVRHLLCDRLDLPDSHRSGEWSVPLAWWAGRAGRTIARIWTKGEQIDIGGPCWRYMTDDAFTVSSSDDQIIGTSCALVISPTSILLPPLTPGSAPILWSTDAR